MKNQPQTHEDRAALQFAMKVSLGIGIFMLLIKIGAFLITGSAAILSDASESVVHVAAVGFAAYSLKLSFKPADAEHLYGHAKISYFSAGFEGAMIVIAALYIIGSALAKWLGGLSLQNLGWGTMLTVLAAFINGGLGLYLVRLGQQKHSIIIEANGKHVLTDCWTSLGVIVGLGLTLGTGWLPWDPICAILVASNILVAGIGLMRKSVGGLMDVADPAIQGQLIAILNEATRQHGIQYHGLRHRTVGDTHWVDIHFLFPQQTQIRDAHRIATQIEQLIEETLQPAAQVTSHLEAVEDHQQTHAHHPH